MQKRRKHIDFLKQTTLVVGLISILVNSSFSQSGTQGNTFLHQNIEMTVFNGHNFVAGGSGSMPGIVGTVRNQTSFMSFFNNGTVSNASNSGHVDGYVKNYNLPNFTFPIGDNNIYGPVAINTSILPSPVTAGYFHADPSIAITSSLLGGNEVPLPVGAPFNTLSVANPNIIVSNIEYWDVNSIASMRISLYWGNHSQINSLSQGQLSNLRIVGWDGSQWVVIPSNINVSSTFSVGNITTSLEIIPNQFNVITLAAEICLDKSILMLGDPICNGNNFQINFNTNGVSVTSTAGIVGTNQITNIPLGSKVTITALSGTGCKDSIVVMGPNSCRDDCNTPLLNIGQAVCSSTVPNTYNVSFSESTGATIQISGGVLFEGIVADIPIGHDLTIRAVHGFCDISYIIKSPFSCTGNSCANQLVSFSGGKCAQNNTTYNIGFIPASGVTVQSNVGIVGPYNISQIPIGSNATIIINSPSCPQKTITISSPSCNNSASIGDFVWHDLNGNGIQDPAEPGIQGVQINLFKGSGEFVNSTFTNVSGKYLFENLLPGKYNILFKSPLGFLPTFANSGNDNVDSDVLNVAGVGIVVSIFVNAGENDMSIDAGFYRCVPIGQLVWYDINKNDVWDTNENGINGLRVNLWRNQGSVWNIFDFKFTGQKPGSASDDGYFMFCAPPGQYYIEVIMPPLGLVRAKQNVGNNENIDSDISSEGKTEIFQVLSGESKTDIGAGFYPMAAAGNLVWVDQNLNGLQETNEPKLKDVKVEAIESISGKVIETVYTDTYGIYNLDYLEKQSYYFKFSPPSGYVATLYHAGPDSLDSDVDHSFGLNTTRAIDFEPGVRNDNIDFGLAFGVLPLQWIDVRVERKNDKHTISWKVADEINVSHYLVERKLEKESGFREISNPIPSIGKIKNATDYSFEDVDILHTGAFYYRIKQIDIDGTFNYSNTVKLSPTVSNAINLFPNPAIDATTITISTDRDVHVDINILDNTNKLIRVVEKNRPIEIGNTEIPIDLKGLDAGLYIINIQAGDIQVSKHLIKIK